MPYYWLYNVPTHKFHAFRPGEFASICGIPRGGNVPIANKDEIPPETRCELCDAVVKRETGKKRKELGITEPEKKLCTKTKVKRKNNWVQTWPFPGARRTAAVGTPDETGAPVEVKRFEDKEPCEHGPETVQDGHVDGHTQSPPELERPPAEIEPPNMAALP